jgi:uncharacterized membrane protein YecN with MAPEG domain
MPVPVTLLYGGVTALLIVLLGLNVTRARGKMNAHFGTSPDSIAREQRAHGNAAEWAPLGILLLLLLELAGVSSLALHVLGGSLVAGRVMHAAGALIRRRTPLVSLGATLNYLVTAVLAGWAVALHFR